MTNDPGKKPPQSERNEPEALNEDIRLRAYQLYEERGREPGDDVDDWQRAEEEITGKRGHTAA